MAGNGDRETRPGPLQADRVEAGFRPCPFHDGTSYESMIRRRGFSYGFRVAHLSRPALPFVARLKNPWELTPSSCRTRSFQTFKLKKPW